MPDINRLPYEEPDWKLLRKLAELRMEETQTRFVHQVSPVRRVDAAIALVKKRASLPYAIELCEKLGQMAKAFWEAADPKYHDSVYENALERLAFETVLSRHNIPQEEVEEAKNLIDARITETLT